MFILYYGLNKLNRKLFTINFTALSYYSQSNKLVYKNSQIKTQIKTKSQITNSVFDIFKRSGIPMLTVRRCKSQITNWGIFFEPVANALHEFQAPSVEVHVGYEHVNGEFRRGTAKATPTQLSWTLPDV